MSHFQDFSRLHCKYASNEEKERPTLQSGFAGWAYQKSALYCTVAAVACVHGGGRGRPIRRGPLEQRAIRRDGGVTGKRVGRVASGVQEVELHATERAPGRFIQSPPRLADPPAELTAARAVRAARGKRETDPHPVDPRGGRRCRRTAPLLYRGAVHSPRAAARARSTERGAPSLTPRHDTSDTAPHSTVQYRTRRASRHHTAAACGQRGPRAPAK